ncbi:MAG: hypothetical protein M1838_005803 [Thelocarpon superellum]|nr:MAG: hypothetical protein M1838_005803 [Thelocarpon superellum]
MASDLVRLAGELLASGPYKQEVTARRVRTLFNNTYVADTTSAVHVWEHPSYPQFYLPLAAVAPNLVTKHASHPIDKHGSAFPATLKVGDKSTDRVLLFEKGPLAGLVRFEFRTMGEKSSRMTEGKRSNRRFVDEDAWFEEDREIYGHPKDPYKRIDTIPSSRTVTISIDGQVVAESNNVMILLETTLPTRYYLPKPSLNLALASPSTTTSLCPYKGVAEYYNITVNGKEYKDIIWWYRYPTSESLEIAGRISGYNEKLDFSIDGVLQERPRSKFG